MPRIPQSDDPLEVDEPEEFLLDYDEELDFEDEFLSEFEDDYEEEEI